MDDLNPENELPEQVPEPAAAPPVSGRWYWVIFPALLVILGVLYFLTRGRTPARPDDQRARKLFESGQYGEALELSRSLLREAEQRQSNDAIVSQILETLAPAARERGEWIEAEAAYERIIAIYRKHARDGKSRSVARLQLSLADLHFTLGRYSEAEAEFESCRQYFEKEHGPDTVDVGECLARRGSLRSLRGQFAEAEQDYRTAIRLFESAGPGFEGDVAGVQRDLSSDGLTLDQYVQADELLSRCEAFAKARYTADHPSITGVLALRASYYARRGQFVRAERMIRQRMAIEERARGVEHPNMADCRADLADCYLNRQQLESAWQEAQQAKALHERSLGPQCADVASDLELLADIALNRGEVAETEKLAKQSWEMRRTLFGAYYYQIASNMHTLAEAALKRNDAAASITYCDRARAIIKMTFRNEGLFLAANQYILGDAHHALGHHAEAEKYYREALTIKERILTLPHPTVARLLDDYAALLRQRGRQAEADALANRAATIREQHKKQEAE